MPLFLGKISVPKTIFKSIVKRLFCSPKFLNSFQIGISDEQFYPANQQTSSWDEDTEADYHDSECYDKLIHFLLSTPCLFLEMKNLVKYDLSDLSITWVRRFLPIVKLKQRLIVIWRWNWGKSRTSYQLPGGVDGTLNDTFVWNSLNRRNRTGFGWFSWGDYSGY